jgi:hypothetical protein
MTGNENQCAGADKHRDRILCKAAPGVAFADDDLAQRENECYVKYELDADPARSRFGTLLESLSHYPAPFVTLLGFFPDSKRDLRAMSKNPLRCVVYRDVRQHRLTYGSTITTFHDVLECGHCYSDSPILPEQLTTKRRRCPACGAGVASIPLELALRKAQTRVA